MLGVIEESTLLEQEGYDLLAAILTNALAVAKKRNPGAAHTVSRRIVQISADPAFVTGMTLINFAFSTFLTLVDLKAASRFTFHLVVSHVRD